MINAFSILNQPDILIFLYFTVSETKQSLREEKQEKAAAKEKPGTQTTRTSGRSTGGRKRKSAVERAADSAVNTIGREIGRGLTRGLLGSLKKLF